MNPPKKHLRKIIKVAVLIVASVLVMCLVGMLIAATVFYPKTHQGQWNVDKQISDAGFASIMKGSYKCGGSLPLVEDNCSLRMEIKTTELTEFEKAQAFGKGVSVNGESATLQLTYGSTRFEVANYISAGQITQISDWLQSQSISKATVNTGNNKGTIDIKAEFNNFKSACSGAESLFPLGYTGISIRASQWSILNVTKEVAGDAYNNACSTIDSFLADAASSHAQVTYQASNTPTGGRVYTTSSNPNVSGYSFDNISTWFASHPLPANITLDVYKR